MVTILIFSGREAGNCANTAKYIMEQYTETEVRKFTISNQFAACGNCDYECLKKNERCPAITEEQAEIMNAILNSELVYYIIPNYCGFPSANYFAFNERSVGFFENPAQSEQYMSIKKRFIIISNTQSEIFDRAMRQQTKDAPDVLYLQSRKYGKQSIAGDILDAEAARAALDAFIKH